MKGANPTFNASEVCPIMKYVKFFLQMFRLVRSLFYNWRVFKETLGFSHSKVLYGVYDDCYIFGSGASLNRLTDDFWHGLDKSLTIGMNEFAVHKWTPDIYFCESLHNQSDNHRFVGNIIKRYKQSDTLVAVEYAPSREGWKIFYNAIRDGLGIRRFVLFQKLALPFKTEECDFLLKMFFSFSLKERFRCLPWRRGSLEKAIYFAASLRVKRIVLVGIDFSSEYFFHSSDRLSEGMILREKNPFDGNVHPTQIPCQHGSTMSQMLSFHKIFLARRNIELLTLHKSDVLAPDLGWLLEQ